MPGETIAQAIERTGGRSRGFDYLRIALSVGVLLWHAARVSYPNFIMSPILRATAGLVLPMFFALSGFLISGSLVRVRSLQEFAMLRAIRIVPALAVETLISLVLIGAIFTTLPLYEFYAHPQTHAYLGNIVGWVHLRLPGVFTDLPFKGVANASLWTVPIELECYLVIMVLWATGVVRRPLVLFAATVAITALVLGQDILHHQLMSINHRVAGRVLVTCFLAGVVLYQYRDRIVLRRWLFILSLVVAGLLMQTIKGSYLVAFPAAYITVYLGMKDPPKLPVLLSGDYSYGIYLYSFPIQQAVTTMLPLEYRQWYVNAPISLAIVSVFAAFSWHFIEKPILARRKHFVGIADRALARIAGKRVLPPDPTDVGAMDTKSRS